MRTKYRLWSMDGREYEHESGFDEPMKLVAHYESYTNMFGTQWLPVKYMGREGIIRWSDVCRVELEDQDIPF